MPVNRQYTYCPFNLQNIITSTVIISVVSYLTQEYIKNDFISSYVSQAKIKVDKGDINSER